MNDSSDSEEETKSNMWIEKEPTKNPKGKNKTKLEKWTVLDAGHRTGINHMTAHQRQRRICPPKNLRESWSLHKIMPIKTKFGSKNETYSI